MLQLKDIDLATDEIRLHHAKGGKEAVLPLAFKPVRDTLYLHLQERGGQADEYLLYPWNTRGKPMSTTAVDNWFKRCVACAELSNYTMHQLRHAAIDEVNRQTHDLEAARQLARHSNAVVTQTYLHSTLEDLRAALESMEVG
jgi:integrase